MKALLTPVGRMVMGSVYEPQTTDFNGKPKTAKNGNPRTEYFFALAIPKVTGQSWKQTEWGAFIEQEARAFFRDGQCDMANFVWKVVDGDSTVKNAAKKPIAPCEREGYPGHWVLTFASGFAPTLVDPNGELLTTPGAINCGDYIQVRANVNPNTRDPHARINTGVFLNHTHVAFIGPGPRIVTREKIDPKTIPFSKQLPANALPVNALARTTPPAPPPYPGILKQRVMLPAANGISYEEYIGRGWTDAQLIEKGLMNG